MNFHKTQENGDATSNYNITTSANTVREFVHEVIEYMQKHNEWGSIYAFASKNSGYITLVDYSRFKWIFQITMVIIATNRLKEFGQMGDGAL